MDEASPQRSANGGKLEQTHGAVGYVRVWVDMDNGVLPWRGVVRQCVGPAILIRFWVYNRYTGTKAANSI